MPAGNAPTIPVDAKQVEIFKEWTGAPPWDFDKRYRALARATDEAVSTASVQAVIVGINKQLGARTSSSEEQRNAIARWLVGVSGLRLETKYVGRGPSKVAQDQAAAEGRTIYSRVQHPSSGGYWAPGFEGHPELDLERRQFVARATQTALKNGGATIESVFKAMIAAGGEFTANVFAAPATASDVQTRVNWQVREARNPAQAVAREAFKKYTLDVGEAGTRGPSSSQPWTAPWSPTDERGLSPERRDSDLAASSSSALSSSTSLASSSSSSSSSSTDLLRLAFPSSYSSSSLSSSSAAATSSPSTDLLSSSSSSPSPMLDVAPL